MDNYYIHNRHTYRVRYDIFDLYSTITINSNHKVSVVDNHKIYINYNMAITFVFQHI